MHPVTRVHHSRDPLATAMYAIGTLPLIQQLQGDVPTPVMRVMLQPEENQDSFAHDGISMRQQAHAMVTTPILQNHGLLSSLSIVRLQLKYSGTQASTSLKVE